MLTNLAIHLQAQVERIRVNLISRYKPWPDRRKCVEAFSFTPLTRTLDLPGALGNVVH
ncbi:hypothetical protein LMG28138_06131 [Pararobbsia alpina]|uniref:Uncharacterized protein n=1 Tax=Pararobbsia alpina TaxID=621374 RepID=A0A6S7BQY6_9BURK|nr:hypothetical protein LMG28138_06131 [Pararobbsia alpina]